MPSRSSFVRRFPAVRIPHQVDDAVACGDVRLQLLEQQPTGLREVLLHDDPCADRTQLAREGVRASFLGFERVDGQGRTLGTCGSFHRGIDPSGVQVAVESRHSARLQGLNAKESAMPPAKRSEMP